MDETGLIQLITIRIRNSSRLILLICSSGSFHLYGVTNRLWRSMETQNNYKVSEPRRGTGILFKFIKAIRGSAGMVKG